MNSGGKQLLCGVSRNVTLQKHSVERPTPPTEASSVLLCSGCWPAPGHSVSLAVLHNALRASTGRGASLLHGVMLDEGDLIGNGRRHGAELLAPSLPPDGFAPSSSASSHRQHGAVRCNSLDLGPS